MMTFKIMQQPVKATEKMPWHFQIRDEDERRLAYAHAGGKIISLQGICTEDGLCHSHDWAQESFGYTGFRARQWKDGKWEPWEPVF